MYSNLELESLSKEALDAHMCTEASSDHCSGVDRAIPVSGLSNMVAGMVNLID